MFTQEQLEIYFKEISETELESLGGYLNKHRNNKEIFDSLLNRVCDTLVDNIQKVYYNYDKSIIKSDPVIKTFLEVSAFIENEYMAYYVALAEFFKGNTENVVKNIKLADKNGFFGNEKEPITEMEFANCFIAPFKSAYHGFWDEIYNWLSERKSDKSVLELCKATKVFYTSGNNLEIRYAVEKVLELNPDSKVARLLLALNYQDAHMWGNAIALFEQLDNGCYILIQESMYFCMAWCYGKLKETANEISYYEKCAETVPDADFIMNNLGYAYYKARQYNKALECFQKCLDNNWDVKYAANNYVRVLLSMKRYKDAKAFVRNTSVKIYKGLLERVKKAENTNKRVKADEPLEMIFESETATAEKEIDLGIKKQQFTSEKILEDEIVLRMDMGLETFGKHLKVYRRKGVYGRQYILSNGKRLDVLAEDSDGNLYVIELKKDSGYDDAYQQTVEYIEWFDSNWNDKTVKISGIICLNNPTEELLEKVHNNPRIRVFEYQISYNER